MNTLLTALWWSWAGAFLLTLVVVAVHEVTYHRHRARAETVERHPSTWTDIPAWINPDHGKDAA